MEQEKLFLAKITDDIRRAVEGNYTVTTWFLTPEEQTLARECAHGKVQVFESGGYVEAERRKLAFCPAYVESAADVAFDIGVVRVEAKQERLGHRNVMGAVLSLGIRRETVGDIALDEKGAWVFCEETMAEYICRNLDRIGRVPVTCETVLPEQVKIPPRMFEQKEIGIASLRLDALVAALLHQSRGRAAELICAGDVSLNHRETKDSSQKVKEGDVLSVRRYGKFVIACVLGQTKKGRQKVLVKQYR